MLFSLSTIARRSAMTLRPRVTSAAAPISTQAAAQVHNLESMLQNMRWSDSKDTVKEIEHLLNEAKTNHAVPEPDAGLEEQVCSSIENIQDLIQTHHATHDQVQHEIGGLKKVLKNKLYYGQ